MTPQATFTRDEVRDIIAEAVRYAREDYRREREKRGETFWEPWMADTNAIAYICAVFGAPLP